MCISKQFNNLKIFIGLEDTTSKMKSILKTYFFEWAGNFINLLLNSFSVVCFLCLFAGLFLDKCLSHCKHDLPSSKLDSVHVFQEGSLVNLTQLWLCVHCVLPALTHVTFRLFLDIFTWIAIKQINLLPPLFSFLVVIIFKAFWLQETESPSDYF